MKVFLLLAAFFLTGCANTALLAAPMRLTGSYQFLGDGDLCFIPTPDSERQFAYWKPGSKLCFSNGDAAIDLIGAREAFDKVGHSHVCGFEGNATIAVTDILAGGDQDDWLYQAKLVSADHVSPHAFILCGS